MFTEKLCDQPLHFEKVLIRVSFASLCSAKAYPEPTQASKMERFAKIVNG